MTEPASSSDVWIYIRKSWSVKSQFQMIKLPYTIGFCRGFVLLFSSWRSTSTQQQLEMKLWKNRVMPSGWSDMGRDQASASWLQPCVSTRSGLGWANLSHRLTFSYCQWYWAGLLARRPVGKHVACNEPLPFAKWVCLILRDAACHWKI